MDRKDEEKDIRRRHVGKFLKAAREKSGLTQEDVAKRLNYSTAQFVSNWERGAALPPQDQLPKLAALLGLSSAEFLEAMYAHHEAMLKLQKRQLAALFRGRSR